MSAPPLTLGTAGHVDHGKTALVGALTGTDTDRLAAEHERGISVELGFAELELGDGRRLSVVDVPGHERFVKTMVAGATGFDMFLLCVAADDGVMPQTREHVAILRRLGVRSGVAAITKSDLASPDRAAAELAALMPAIRTIPISVRTREGLTDLNAAIAAVVGDLPSRRNMAGPARLHVDRAFTLKGIGTVATGTLWAGQLATGDRVRLLPAGREARIRSLQIHGREVERADAGQRVAVALSGVRRGEVARGDVLCALGAALHAVYRIDAGVELDPGSGRLAGGTRVQVHHGTRECSARFVPLDGDEVEEDARGYAQLRLESPLVAAAGDAFVLRRLAPPATIGGGVIIEPGTRRHGPGAAVVARLRALERGDEPPAARTAEPDRHPSGGDAPPPAPDGTCDAIAALLEADGARPRPDAVIAESLGLSRATATAALARLVADERAVRTGPRQHFAAAALERLSREVVGLCHREGGVTISSVRDELGISRRHAQALLEHLDRQRITLRVGDERTLRGGPGDRAAKESNLPSGGLPRPPGFEDRMGHQTRAAREER